MMLTTTALYQGTLHALWRKSYSLDSMEEIEMDVDDREFLKRPQLIWISLTTRRSCITAIQESCVREASEETIVGHQH